MMSTLYKFVGFIAWLITALASINVGLMPFGYDFFASNLMMDRFLSLNVPLHYVVGVAGLICLVMFVQTVTGHCHCGNSNCPSCGGK